MDRMGRTGIISVQERNHLGAGCRPVGSRATWLVFAIVAVALLFCVRIAARYERVPATDNLFGGVQVQVVWHANFFAAFS